MPWALFFTRKARVMSRLKTASEISRQLPPFVMRVGVFVNAPADFVMRAIGECHLTCSNFTAMRRRIFARNSD